MSTERNYQEVSIDLLVDFKDHPFKPYEGQRFTDMVESIRANGVITPIIVRPIEDGKYQILSGHNRTKAAKEAGLETVPAIIREGLTEDEALLIMTESNLIQRSFADLRHSERAIALTTHYEAMKKKSGYRSDLLDGIEELTSAPLGRRSDTRDKIGEQYDLGKTTIARYLRVNKLVPELKERLDNEEIGIRVAESLSYLRPKEQEILERVIDEDPKRKITMKKADDLRKASAQSELNITQIKRSIPHVSKHQYIPPVRLYRLDSRLQSYLTPKQRKDEMFVNELEIALIKSLEEYLKIDTTSDKDL